MRTRVGPRARSVGPLLRSHRSPLPARARLVDSATRGQVLGIAAVVFFASLSTLGVIGTEFVPEEDRGQFEVNRRAAARHVVRAERRDGRARSRSRSRSIPEVRQVFSTVGVNGDPLKANLQVKTTPKQRARARTAGDQGRRAAAASRRCRWSSRSSPIRSSCRARRSQAPISVFLRGDDMDELQRLSDEIVAKIRQVPGTVDVDSTLESGQPEMVARVNRELAADLGLRRRQRRDAAARHGRRRRADAGCARATRNTTSASGSRRSSATTSRRSRARRSTRRAARWCARRTSRRWSPGVGPTNIEREQRRRQAKIDVELSDRPLGDVTTDVADGDGDGADAAELRVGLCSATSS